MNALRALRSLFAYPLLARELTERAARKRTYAVRVAYGLVLYGLFIFAVQRLVGEAASDPTGLGGLGFGRELFRTFVDLQCWGVLLLQPALMAGVLTYEKERDSLSLLVLTGMRPGKIIVEKFLAGLLPMATLLLLALPLGAITMGYGGVSVELLTSGACVILATWLMAGAFALLCSAWCQTTVGATLASYLLGAALLIAPALVYSLSVRYVLWGANLTGVALPDFLWAVWPPEVFARVLEWQEGAESLATGGPGWSAILGKTWEHCTPMLGLAAICLGLSVLVLHRRALTSTAPRLPGARRQFPRAIQCLALAATKVTGWWNRFWPPPPALPIDDPVAWRESGRSRMGGRGYFLYSSFMLAGGTLAVSLLLLAIYPQYDGPTRLHYLALLLGAAFGLVLIVRTAGSLLNEHTNQTLAILLTAPIGAHEIVSEKARALSRYRLIIALVLGTVFALQGWAEFRYVRELRWQGIGQYWACSALALAVYPGLLIWGTLLISLLLRARTKAILVAIGVFAVWFVAPIAILNFTIPDWRGIDVETANTRGLWLSLLSPLGILDANECDNLAKFSVQVQHAGYIHTGVGQPWVPVAANFGAYFFLTHLFRRLCHSLADRLLRR